MPPVRSRAVGLAAATSMLLAFGAQALPVTAADSPEAAVHAVLDASEAGAYDSIDALVCEAERENVRAMLDPSAQMGLDVGEGLTFVVEDRVVEVLDQSDDEATARLIGTMRMSVDGEERPELARQMAEEQLGPDASEEELVMAMPFIEMVLSMDLPIDQELTLVQEEGEWLVCGGLGEPVDDPDDYGVEPSVSSEGLCVLAGPDELSALGGLVYDSSAGFDVFCNYSTSDYEDYHSTNVSLELDDDVESLASIYQADQPLSIVGQTAFATGPDGYGEWLLAQVGPDVLLVSVLMPPQPPDGVDWLSQATLVAEFLSPRVAEARVDLAGPTPAPTPQPTPEVSLCEALPLAAANELTGLGFDAADGDGSYCGYQSDDGEPGYHFLTVSLLESALDDYVQWLPDPTETTIGDLRAAEAADQLIVELPGGSYLLTVSGYVDTQDESAAVTTQGLQRLVAEAVLTTIDVPEPTVEPGNAGALLEDPFASEPLPTLPQPMCHYLDLEAVNALGIVEFDVQDSFFDEHCWLSRSDPSDGFAEVSVMLDGISIEEARTWYPDGTDLTVGGFAAFAGGNELRVETDAGSLGFTALLPASAIEAGVRPVDLSVPVAALVIAAIEADVAGE